MKILVDENIGTSVVQYLRSKGHDVFGYEKNIPG